MNLISNCSLSLRNQNHPVLTVISQPKPILCYANEIKPNVSLIAVYILMNPSHRVLFNETHPSYIAC
jgi:hypothetical protein